MRFVQLVWFGDKNAPGMGRHTGSACGVIYEILSFSHYS